MWFFLVVAIVSYLLGSINGAILVSKMYKKGDIRNYGSGNAGSTNVLRTVGKSAAALTFLFDILKCVIAVIGTALLLQAVIENNPDKVYFVMLGKYVAGISCVLGHIFPAYFGFKGGKGVATAAAMMAVIDWRIFTIVFAVFLISFLVKKIVSLSAILAAITYPIATYIISFLFDYDNAVFSNTKDLSMSNILVFTSLSLIVAFIIIVKHKENIKRIINGTEKPIIGKN